MTNQSLALSAGIASVVTAAALIGIKFWALHQTGALSVGASLADSLLDAVASAMGLAALVYAARPADSDHRFGHGSVEDIAALAQATLVLVAAGVIAWGVVYRLAVPTALEHEDIGLGAMAASIPLTLCLVAWQSHVARRTGSPVVAADRLHYIADALPNLGAIVALLASQQLGVGWVDSAVSAVTAVILIAAAWRILRKAFDALMDREADADLPDRVVRIAGGIAGLAGVHDVKSRRAGQRVFIQLHAEIDGARPLAEAHAIGEALRLALLDRYPNAEILIHKDPV